MMISQGLSYIVAVIHAPKGARKEFGQNEEKSGLIEGQYLQLKIDENDIRLTPFELDGSNRSPPGIGEGFNPEAIGKLLRVVLKQPVLPASLIGLLLSVCEVGMPPELNIVMFECSKGFRYGLYLMLGLYTALADDVMSIRLIAGALGLRFIIAGIVAVFLWLYMPVSSIVRTSMAMAALAPASTMPINLMAEFSYEPRFAEMATTLTTISVIISFAVEQSVMAFY